MLQLLTATETNTNILNDTSDDISVDELLKLKKEIDSFINAQDAAEQAFCDGNVASKEIQELATLKASALKKRIRGLAIALGIHADFLAEYDSTCNEAVLSAVSPF